MSLARRILTSKDETAPWRGGYARYDLVKELCIALAVITALAVLLAALFSSPDLQPSTIAAWSRQMPVNFLATASKELDGTSETAEYGPPYNKGKGFVQHAAFIHLQEWLGISHPIDPAKDYVIDPLRTVTGDPALSAALQTYERATPSRQRDWAQAYAKPLEAYEAAFAARKAPTRAVAVNERSGTVTVAASGAGPVPTMMSVLLNQARSGALDGILLTSRHFYQTDYTKPLLFIADGALLEKRAQAQHLLGNQWGMMNETGSYPGQVWLWLYTFWYQIEPFSTSHNADLLVMLVMAVLSLAFVLIPFLPVVRDIPRAIPLYRLIWREHYRSTQEDE